MKIDAKLITNECIGLLSTVEPKTMNLTPPLRATDSLNVSDCTSSVLKCLFGLEFLCYKHTTNQSTFLRPNWRRCQTYPDVATVRPL